VLQLDKTDPISAAAAVLKSGLDSGRLEGIFKDLVVSTVGVAVDPIMSKLMAATTKMEAVATEHAELSKALRKQQKKHNEDIANLKGEAAQTLALVKKLAQVAGLPTGGAHMGRARSRGRDKTSRKRSPTPSASSGDDSSDDPEAEAEEEQDGWPPVAASAVKPAKQRSGKLGKKGAATGAAADELKDQGLLVLKALCKDFHSQDANLVGQMLEKTGMSKDKREAFAKEMLKK
jgi:NTP pyrophosphatase (non-canonical NTP hydrolase)